MNWTSAPAAVDPKLPENHLACPRPRRPGPAPHFKHPFLSLSCQLLLLHSETPPRSPSCVTSSRKPSLCSRAVNSFLLSWSRHLRPTSPDALHTEQTLLGWSTTRAWLSGQKGSVSGWPLAWHCTAAGGWAAGAGAPYRFHLPRGRGSALDVPTERAPGQALGEVASSPHAPLSVLQQQLQLVCGEKREACEACEACPNAGTSPPARCRPARWPRSHQDQLPRWGCPAGLRHGDGGWCVASGSRAGPCSKPLSGGWPGIARGGCGWT